MEIIILIVAVCIGIWTAIYVVIPLFGKLMDGVDHLIGPGTWFHHSVRSKEPPK
jgi:hypothetical protein